jgi:signal transduction histidine kinase
MINLIEELMSDKNTDEGKYVQNTVWDSHNIEEIIQIVKGNLKLEIEKAKPELILPISFPKVYADKNLLVSLFQNLISNAIKYRKKDVNLRIEIVVKDYDPTTWLFSVSDNGIGIEKEKHESIFDLYNRVADDLATGHGIGLSFCRKIVEQYSGKIWVDSASNIGSTFFFTLPKIDGGDVKIDTRTKTQNI